MDNVEKPKKKRGRPPKKVVEAKTQAVINKGGQPKKRRGKYDLWDERTLHIMETHEKVYFIARHGGSQLDCARYAGVSQQAVSKIYGKDYYDGKARMKMEIRAAQFGKAYDGDSNLLRHLGMVHCDEQQNAGRADIPKEELRGIVEMLAGRGIRPQDLIFAENGDDNETSNS